MIAISVACGERRLLDEFCGGLGIGYHCGVYCPSWLAEAEEQSGGIPRALLVATGVVQCAAMAIVVIPAMLRGNQ